MLKISNKNALFRTFFVKLIFMYSIEKNELNQIALVNLNSLKK